MTPPPVAAADNGDTLGSCPVCFEVFSDAGDEKCIALVLRCGHSICDGCASTLCVPDKQPNTLWVRTYACPMCRTIHRTETDQRPPVNHSLMELRRDNRAPKRAHESPAAPDVVIKPPPSTDADDAAPADDCGGNKRVKQSLCAEHDVQPLDYWCRECNLRTCAKCALVKCRAHTLTDVAKDGPQRLASYAARVAGHVGALRHEIAEFSANAELMAAHYAERAAEYEHDAFRAMREELDAQERAAQQSLQTIVAESRASIKACASAATEEVDRYDVVHARLRAAVSEQNYWTVYTDQSLCHDAERVVRTSLDDMLAKRGAGEFPGIPLPVHKHTRRTRDAIALIRTACADVTRDTSVFKSGNTHSEFARAAARRRATAAGEPVAGDETL
jgi:hypothetical protein